MVILALILIVPLPTSHQRRNGRPTQARDTQRLAQAALDAGLDYFSGLCDVCGIC